MLLVPFVVVLMLIEICVHFDIVILDASVVIVGEVVLLPVLVVLAPLNSDLCPFRQLQSTPPPFSLTNGQVREEGW